MTITLDSTELTAWMERAKDVFTGQQRTEINAAVGRVIGVALEAEIPEYPEQSGKKLEQWYTLTTKTGKTYKSKFKSVKQQAYVMALVAKGGVPYRRTGQLGKSITSAVSAVTPSSVTVEIGSNNPSSPYVIDETQQSHYHMGNWWTLQGAVQAGIPRVTEAAGRAYTNEVEKRLKG